MAKSKESIAVLAGMLAGAAMGVVAGMLFAPEKGEETRKKIRRKADDFKHQAQEEYDKMSEKLKSEYDHFSGKAKENYDKFVSGVKEGYGKYKDQTINKVSDVAEDIETELDAMK